ncbi:MAG: iron uptake porin, partial [Cyanobacteria bacterium J06581_3]
ETVESAEISSEVVVAEPIQLAQVTNVSELSDVQPGDWAFTALQRLVEEYGCLEGYPDRTYRGNRALTRYEFAAGLNACLDVVLQLIGDGDLEEIRRLQEEFAAELATIRGRVDTLETDVAELEANQFSTTTKLRGSLDAHLVVPFGDADFEFDTDGLTDEEIIAVAPGLFEDDGAGVATPTDGTTVAGTVASRDGDEADATFEYRARLNFDTSFTGEDRLRIRLQAGDNGGSLANTATTLNGGGLANSAGGSDNVSLNDVYYSFPVGNRISAIIAANSVETDDFVTSTIVPFDGPSVADAGGPEFYDLFEGGDFGAGVNFAFSDNLVLDLGYSSEGSNINTSDTGLFNNNSYIAQLNFLTDGILDAAITYIGAGDADLGEAESTIAGLINLDFGGFQVGGHYANTDIDGFGDVDSFMGGVAFSDFLGAGNEFGIYGGISPAIDREPVLVEAYYEINVNEFFSFTPAIIYTDNDSDADESDNVYGAVRASFSF